MIVAKLTPAQKDLIHGKQYAQDSYFHCIQDANDNWVISFEEWLDVANDYHWVRQCPLINYEPKIIFI